MTLYSPPPRFDNTWGEMVEDLFVEPSGLYIVILVKLYPVTVKPPDLEQLSLWSDSKFTQGNPFSTFTIFR